NRYALTGSVSGTGSVLTGSVTSGEVSAVEGQDWGGWNIELDGAFTGIRSSSWATRAGGAISSSSGSNGYWLEIIDGSQETSELDYMTHTTIGHGTGTVISSFDEEAGTFQITDSGEGTLAELRLLHVSDASPDIFMTEKAPYNATYYYADGSIYQFDYNAEDNSGSFGFLDSQGNFEQRYYFSDGTWTFLNQGTGETAEGTWGPDTFDLLEELSTLPDIGEPDQTTITREGDALVKTGAVDALLGGTATFWNGSGITVDILGSYTVSDSLAGIWQGEVFSHDYITGLDTTYDEFPGAYHGLVGGIISSDEFKGGIHGIYIDPSGNAGILLSEDLHGPAYTGINMLNLCGAVTLLEIEQGIGVDPADIETSLSKDGIFFNGDNGSFGVGGEVFASDSQGFMMSLNNKTWGVWQTALGGAYTGASSDDWSLQLSNYNGARLANVIGSKWSDGEIAANVTGAWIDLDDAMTGVFAGNLKGTFDPSNWQAYIGGGFLDTTTFLTMIANNPAFLQTLNIPAVEVGKESLTGTNGNLVVNMNDVTFFANTVGGSPEIWATKDVNGSYGVDPVSGSTVSMAGTNLNAQFKVKVWNNNSSGKWGASVNNGTGTVSGNSVTFKGGAAGTINSDTNTFSGTGAGVASP
ncbi:MAG: hypothetical protein U9R20_00085, partial [Thermodesulfobacteriota bacterium]|nr:hypothetical protein [Thermodesulfobacteriota bacterium]